MRVVRRSLPRTYETVRIAHCVASLAGGNFSTHSLTLFTLLPLFTHPSTSFCLTFTFCHISFPRTQSTAPGTPEVGLCGHHHYMGLTSREWAWGLSRAKTTTTTCDNNKRHNLRIIWIPAGLPTYHCLHPSNRYTKGHNCEPSSAAGPLPTGFSAGLQRAVGGGWTSTWRSLRSER